MKTVEEGWPPGMPLVEKLDKSLWEVRSNINDGCITRVFFTIAKHDMVLLHGIKKKAQKTPKKDLDLAKPTKYRFKNEVGDMMKNKHIGSSFNDFLEEEGILGKAQAIAVARVLAWEVNKYLAEHNTTKTAFAKVLETSRMQVNRLTDPEDTSVSLNTMAKVAEVMGKKLELRLV